MSAKFFRVSLKIYLIKEKLVFVSRTCFSFRFLNSWRALLKMVFPITVMANLSIGGTFTTLVRIFTKLAFFNYVFSLSGGLASCKSVVSFDLRISRVFLRVSSATWPADIALGSVNSDSRRRRPLKELPFVSQTIISFLKKSWRVSNSYSELLLFSVM